MLVAVAFVFLRRQDVDTETDDPKQNSEQGQFNDAFPLVLDEAAQQELLSAAREDDKGRDDHVEQPPVETQQDDAASVPKASKRQKTQPGQSGTTISKIGISDVAKTKRAGVVCFHCNSPLAKGDLRFVYVWKRDKPPRSIHPHCVSQLDENACNNSILFLQNLMDSNPPSEPDARQACIEALATLNSLKTVFAV